MKNVSVSGEYSDAALKMVLIELQCDSTPQYHSNNDLTFYSSHLPMTGYPQLSIHAKIVLCLFGSTYLCDTFFSKMKFA